MALADPKMFLSKRRSLLAADVESVYGELVRVIGGTRFVNGTPTGPTNGLLDWRNFTPDAGIPNTNKAAPWSVYCISLYQDFFVVGGASTTMHTYAPFPFEDIGVVTPLSSKVIGLTVAVQQDGSAVNSGTITVAYIRNGTATTIGSAVPWVNVPSSTPTTLSNQALSSPILQAKDLVRLEATSATVAFQIRVVAQLILKAQHTR